MSIYGISCFWSKYEYSFLRVISEANKEIAEKIIKCFENDSKISPDAMEEAKAILEAKTW